MTTGSQQRHSSRWLFAFLAALVAVLATVFGAATASAATTGVAETRVGASNDSVEVLVEPPRRETAGQRLGNDPAGPEIVVATGVAANTEAKACGFAGTTTVLMADGSRKAIEDVEVGDKVIATDPETGEQVAKTVEHVWVHDDTVVDLVVDGEVITTTEDNPFWSVTDRRFERADELSGREKVLGVDGRVVEVSGLRIGTAREALAYNLTVEGIHTYHVGDAEILVHNDCGYTPAGGFADSDLDEVAQSVYQHAGGGDIPGRPSLSQIQEALTRGVPEALEQGDGSIARVINHGGVRVIINEDSPWRSTAYFPGIG